MTVRASVTVHASGTVEVMFERVRGLEDERKALTDTFVRSLALRSTPWIFEEKRDCSQS